MRLAHGVRLQHRKQAPRQIAALGSTRALQQGSILPSLALRAKAFLQWLVLDPIVLWAALGLPLVILPVAFAYLPTAAELSVRIAGYLIALLGVLLVVKGIRDKRRLFGRPALPTRTLAWLRRLPPILLLAKRATGSSTVSLGGASISATGHVSAVLSTATPSVEERVRVLEANLRLVEARIDSHR